jgi:hypothetical protein
MMVSANAPTIIRIGHQKSAGPVEEPDPADGNPRTSKFELLA